MFALSRERSVSRRCSSYRGERFFSGAGRGANQPILRIEHVRSLRRCRFIPSPSIPAIGQNDVAPPPALLVVVTLLPRFPPVERTDENPYLAPDLT